MESETGEAESETGEAESERGEMESETGEAESETGEAESERGEIESERGEMESETGEAESETGRTESETGEAESEGGEMESEHPGARGAEPTAPDARAVLDALHDRDCRAIVGAVTDGPMTAAELSEACDLPLSTTYRKVETPVEASLVAERTRVGGDGNHASQYRRSFEDLTIHVDGDDGPEVHVERPDGWPRPSE